MLAIGMIVAFLATPGESVEWGGFRGPNGAGHGCVTRLPERLDVDENLAWRVAAPPGYSSPVVAGRRVVLTGVVGRRLLTAALDLRSGATVWSRGLPLEGEPPRRSSAAASTPATDGTVVVSVFHNAGVVAYDLRTGRERWRFDPRPFSIPHGMASSPVIHGGLVVLLIDQHVGSRLVALDRDSGEVRWETPRPHARAGYATPALHLPADGPAEVVVAGSYRVSGYALEDGAERWWARGAGFMVKGVPVVDGDVVYANTLTATFEEVRGERIDQPWEELLEKLDGDGDAAIAAGEWGDVSRLSVWKELDLDGDGRLTEDEYTATQVAMRSPGALLAIRLGGEGDVSDTHVLWRRERRRGVPDVASPLVVGDRLLCVRDGGIVSVFDGATGALGRVRRLDVRGEVFASPVEGDGKVYVAWFGGVVAVLDAGTLATLSSIDLGGEIAATPVLVGDRVLVRTATELLALREGADAPRRPPRGCR